MMFFSNPKATKLMRLYIFMMTLAGYSLIATIFTPTQIEKNPTFSVLLIFRQLLLTPKKGILCFH